MYHDLPLKNDFNFQGEMIEPWQRHSTMSVIKTHWPQYRDKEISTKATHAIYILRSPFDALLSEFNREFSADRTSHVDVAPMAEIQRQYAGWAQRRHLRWVESAEFWIGTTFPNATLGRVVQRTIRKAKPQQTVSVLVLFYEVRAARKRPCLLTCSAPGQSGLCARFCVSGATPVCFSQNSAGQRNAVRGRGRGMRRQRASPCVRGAARPRAVQPVPRPRRGPFRRHASRVVP